MIGGDPHDHDDQTHRDGNGLAEGGTLPLELRAYVPAGVPGGCLLDRRVLRHGRARRLSRPDRPGSGVLYPGAHRQLYAADARVDERSSPRTAPRSRDGGSVDGSGYSPRRFGLARHHPNERHIRVGSQPVLPGHARAHAVSPQPLYGEYRPPRLLGLNRARKDARTRKEGTAMALGAKRLRVVFAVALQDAGEVTRSLEIAK